VRATAFGTRIRVSLPSRAPLPETHHLKQVVWGDPLGRRSLRHLSLTGHRLLRLMLRLMLWLVLRLLVLRLVPLLGD
jgi:hypothetical protein